MENWGAIFYKEQFLIGDETSHHFDILRILQVVAHELSHQFFGNLVTSKDEEFLWLNEGFATLFEYQLVDKIHPDLRQRDFFNVEKKHKAFIVDSYDSSTPAWGESGEMMIREMVYDKRELFSCLIFVAFK